MNGFGKRITARGDVTILFFFSKTNDYILHSKPYIYVSYRVFNCILVHFIPLPVFIFYSFTGIYILLILFLYSILSTLFPCTLYGLIFSFSFSLFLFYFCLLVFLVLCTSVDGTVPAWVGLYRVVSLCVRVCLCADVLSLSCVCQCVTILCG